MQKSLQQTTFVIVDLETTGASPKKGAAITEIGAVKVRGGEQIGEFSTFVNPLAPLPNYITEMTGITDLMLARAPVIDEVFPTFLEFAGSHTETILVAHNAPFDLSFLKSAAKDLDYTWPKYQTLDTVTVARQLLTKEDVPNCKLSTAAAYFGTQTEPTHRALDDARATTEILHGLFEKLGSLQIYTIEALLEFAKTAAHIQRKNYWGLTSI
ncbi:MAG: exonuclease domain-containing protein [Candidatus Nanopelagicus sp.]